MSAVDVFGLPVPLSYLLMLGIETLFPARQFPAAVPGLSRADP